MSSDKLKALLEFLRTPGSASHRAYAWKSLQPGLAQSVHAAGRAALHDRAAREHLEEVLELLATDNIGTLLRASVFPGHPEAGAEVRQQLQGMLETALAVEEAGRLVAGAVPDALVVTAATHLRETPGETRMQSDLTWTGHLEGKAALEATLQKAGDMWDVALWFLSESPQEGGRPVAFYRTGPRAGERAQVEVGVAFHDVRQGESSGLACPLVVELLEGGDGKLVPAPDMRLVPMAQDFQDTVQRAWDWACSLIHPALPPGDARWRLTGRLSKQFTALEGPSLGAGFAVAFRALLTGEPVYARAFITGTIAEDGAIGPVAGLEHKSLAVRAARASVLMVPVDNESFTVDAAPGLEDVRGVRSVDEAFRILADMRLGRWILDVSHHMNRHQGFVGRDHLMKRVQTHLADPTWESGYLLLVGEPGAGKSAFVAQCIRNAGATPVHHFISRNEAMLCDPERILRSLHAQILSRHGLRETETEQKLSARSQLESALQRLSRSLQQTSTEEPKRAVLYVDGLDEALGALGLHPNTPVPLPTYLPAGVFVVVTSRPGTHLDLGGFSHSGCRRIDVSNELVEENHEDVRRYLQGPVSSLTPELLEVAVTKSQGNFAYAVHLKNWLRGLDKVPTAEMLPDGFPAMVGDLAQRLEQTACGKGVPDGKATLLLGLLALAREPLSLDALQSLLQTSDWPGCYPARDVLRHLRTILAVAVEVFDRPDRGSFSPHTPYQFSHLYFADHFLQALSNLECEDAHRLLGHGSPRWKSLQCVQSYLLRYGVGHLLEGQRPGEAETVLLDVHFAEGMCREAGPTALATAYEKTADALDETDAWRRVLRLLGEAVRLDRQFLSNRPEHFFQTMWSRCWWYDSPEAARHYDEPEGGWGEPPPWVQMGQKLYQLVDGWRESWQSEVGSVWLRALSPPTHHLGTALMGVLCGHAGFVKSVAFSPDGRRMVSGSYDGTVRLWDAETGQELRVLRGHEGLAFVDSVAFSPDGRRIVSGSLDNTVRLWDAETGQELRVLRGHEETVNSVAFSPDGRSIVSGSTDRTVRLWNAESGQELQALRGHEDTVMSVAFNADGRRIVSGSLDNTARLWDAKAGHELRVLRGHEATVTGVAFSSDGRSIVSGSGDKTVRLWDADTGQELRLLPAHEYVASVALSPDERRIMCGSNDGTVRLWDAETGQELRVLRGHVDRVTSVAFSSDGRRIVSGSLDNTVRLWDPEAGQELRVLHGHEGTVESVAISPDGRHIVSGSWDKTVRLWDAEAGQELWGGRAHDEYVTSVAFNPDGRRIVSGSPDGTVRLWDADTGQELRVLRAHDEWVTSVAFSPDGRRIVSGSQNGTVRLWDAETVISAFWKWLRSRFSISQRVLRGHEHKGVWSVAFSPDGRRIVSGFQDGTVCVWDAKTGEELRVLLGHEHWVRSVAVSPDGRRIVSGSADRTVRLWDAETGACLEILQGRTAVPQPALSTPETHPWLPLNRGAETVVLNHPGRTEIARIPIPLEHVQTSPTNPRLILGSHDRRIAVFVLEGGSN